MNVVRCDIWLVVAAVLPVGSSLAASAPRLVRQGNSHYVDGQYKAAAELYDQALSVDEQCLEAQYNRACAVYKQEQYDQAVAGYKAIAAQSEDKGLAVRAKYNLGNSHFRQGLQVAQENPQAALDAMAQAIEAWRQVQQMDPGHAEVDRNIEVGRLWMRNLKGQMEQQTQQQPSEQNEQSESGPSDPNSMQDQKSPQPSDPNMPADEPQQKPGEQQSPEQQDTQEQGAQQGSQQEQEQAKAEPTGEPQESEAAPMSEEEFEAIQARQAKVEEILEQEREAKKMRVLLRQRRQEVDKDW